MLHVLGKLSSLIISGMILLWRLRYAPLLEGRDPGKWLLVGALALFGLAALWSGNGRWGEIVGGILYVLALSLIWAGLRLFLQEVERRLRALKREAETDFLTGLYNRRFFVRALDSAVEQSNRCAKFAVAILDLDNMKDINDRLGHQKGDEVLKRVGRALERSAGPEDVVARFGGDEFAVLFRGSRLKVEDFCRELAEQVAESMKDLGGVAVGISLGVAFYPEDGRDSTTLLSTADRRMYGNKPERHLPSPQGYSGIPG